MAVHGEEEQRSAQPPDDGASPQARDGGARQRPPAGSHHGERHPNGWRVTPGPGGRGAPPAEPFRWNLRSLLPYAIALAVFELALLTLFHAPAPARVQIPYSPFFVDQVQAGNVVSINTQGSTVKGEFRRPMRYPPSDRKSQPTTHFATEIPTFANQDELAALLRQSGVVINAKAPKEGQSFLASLLLALLPLLLIVALFVFIARRAAGGVGGVSSFGKARTRRVEQSVQTITFADVAGIDEAKAELFEIVDFLREPDKYRRLGGRIPRGVLLTGPPGTGKTLLARALAGEAQVPFFSISASEFVEMFVGVGAARVRDLFQQAKEAAPAIIFIDELDAIGGKRGAVPGGYGGHDEREQTLNQILTEMDGFDPSIGVIVLSATNRPDVLDPALLRPGRFDRRVAIQPPDTDGRRQILAVHTRSVPLAPDADLDRLASMTVGMVGADLANVVNEAALMAARHSHPVVTRADFDDALEKLILGSERRILLSEDERERSAYHEAGHALVAMLTPGSDPVRKVSIIPRGAALGVTLSAPGADRFSYDRSYLLSKVKVGLGGRTAEELVFGEITTGAQNDIKQITEVARAMVSDWGMSDLIGPVAIRAPDQPAGWIGSEASPATQQLADEEVRRIVDDAHTEVTKLLSANRGRLDALARALLEHETLDESEARAAAGVAEPAAPARQRSLGSLTRFAGLAVLGALGLALLSSAASANAGLVVDGRGNGHGIGMSQYGAYGYALKGHRSYPYILGHYYPGTSLRHAVRRTVRVLLKRGPSLLVTEATSLVAPGRRPISLHSDRTYRFEPDPAGLLVTDTRTGKPRAHVASPATVRGAGHVRLRGRADNGVMSGRYRGELVIGSGPDGITAIDRVDLEQYLYAVVPSEMPASWPMQALESQAVAARSYALRSLAPAAPFDVHADTRSQMYRGMAAESSRTTSAVRGTRAEALFFGGTVAATYFYSSSGGRTAAIDEEWGGPPISYLRSVSDPYDYLSPTHRWNVTLTTAEAERRLGGLLQGRLQGLSVSARNSSGRAARVEIRGSEAVTTASGVQIRTALKLRSAWFTLRFTP